MPYCRRFLPKTRAGLQRRLNASNQQKILAGIQPAPRRMTPISLSSWASRARRPCVNECKHTNTAKGKKPTMSTTLSHSHPFPRLFFVSLAQNQGCISSCSRPSCARSQTIRFNLICRRLSTIPTGMINHLATFASYFLRRWRREALRWPLSSEHPSRRARAICRREAPMKGPEIICTPKFAKGKEGIELWGSKVETRKTPAAMFCSRRRLCFKLFFSWGQLRWLVLKSSSLFPVCFYRGEGLGEASKLPTKTGA